MSFLKPTSNPKPLVDTVFAISNLAEQQRKTTPSVINATIGSLYNEDHQLVAYETLFQNLNTLPNTIKASYAKSFVGNPDFLQTITPFITNNTLTIPHTTIATPGGTGAISATFSNILEENETIILPDIAWGSYKLMAEVKHLNTLIYTMFEDDHFNLNSLISCIEEVSKTQQRILFVLNDPCHNPTGYSLSNDEWMCLATYLNKKSKTHKIILLNDIAYIDYSFNLTNSRSYMQHFNNLNENILTIIAFSCSKTFTAYGMRVGGAILINQNQDTVQQVKVAFDKYARATWSNIPNAPMHAITNTLNNDKQAFLNEKQTYINLLNKRATLFLTQAKEVNLPTYPYKEGFFITIPIDNDKKQAYHEALINHHIYTVQVNKGIRIALCSLSLQDIDTLAYRLKDILDSI